MYPEVSNSEEKTSARVRAELDKLQIPYVQLPPAYGIVATIKGARPGKRIAVRADMDALPMQEEKDVPYKSKIDGVMHSCGHDAHTAMLLGAANVLAQLKDQLAGEVLLCFQSAEEIGLGAKEILEHLDQIGGVDQVIALHIWGSIPEGEIMLIPGSCMAGSDGFIININGKGGHGARPDIANDPIKAACEMVLKMASIPSNYYDVLDPCVVSTGVIHSGTLRNIFPDTATVEGTIRYFKVGGNLKVHEKIREIAKGIEIANKVQIDFQTIGSVPPVFNHQEPIQKAISLAKEVQGLKAVGGEPICASENYGYYMMKYPGFMAFLGGMNPDKDIVYPQHHCKFDVDETALRKGYEFVARYVLDFLQ